jgi:hypothetical protein
MLAGAYIVAFWVIELTGISGRPVAAVVPIVERASSLLTNFIGDDPLLWRAAFATIIIASAAAGLRAGRRPRPQDVERRERRPASGPAADAIPEQGSVDAT